MRIDLIISLSLSLIAFITIKDLIYLATFLSSFILLSLFLFIVDNYDIETI